MNSLREAAYRIDPALWVSEVLGLEPRHGRRNFCARRREPRFWR